MTTYFLSSFITLKAILIVFHTRTYKQRGGIYFRKRNHTDEHVLVINNQIFFFSSSSLPNLLLLYYSFYLFVGNSSSHPTLTLPSSRSLPPLLSPLVCVCVCSIDRKEEQGARQRGKEKRRKGKIVIKRE